MLSNRSPHMGDSMKSVFAVIYHVWNHSETWPCLITSCSSQGDETEYKSSDCCRDFDLLLRRLNSVKRPTDVCTPSRSAGNAAEMYLWGTELLRTVTPSGSTMIRENTCGHPRTVQYSLYWSIENWFETSKQWQSSALCQMSDTRRSASTASFKNAQRGWDSAAAIHQIFI